MEAAVAIVIIVLMLIAMVCNTIVMIHACQRSTKEGILYICVPFYAFYYMYEKFNHSYRVLVIIGSFAFIPVQCMMCRMQKENFQGFSSARGENGQQQAGDRTLRHEPVPVRHEPAPARHEPAPVLTGALAVSTEPAGATVFIDGREVGRAPTTVSGLSRGPHEIRVVLEGYEAVEGSVEIRPPETRTVTEVLTALEPAGPVEMGRLTLTSRPPARVFFRGRDLGMTPLSDVSLPAGVLALELETPDGQRQRRGVVVRANDRAVTHIDLTSTP